VNASFLPASTTDTSSMIKPSEDPTVDLNYATSAPTAPSDLSLAATRTRSRRHTSTAPGNRGPGPKSSHSADLVPLLSVRFYASQSNRTDVRRAL
jgi:hypothetical protein